MTTSLRDLWNNCFNFSGKPFDVLHLLLLETEKKINGSIDIRLSQFLVALAMVCAPAGVNPIQRYLIGHFTLAPRHPRERDHRQHTTKGSWCKLREKSLIKYIKTVVSNSLLLTACLSRRIHFVTLETLWRDAIAFHVIPLKKRVQLNAFSFFSYGMVNTLRFGLFSD